MALIYLDLETTLFFSSPEIARLPRAQQIPALAAHFGCAVTVDAERGQRFWWPPQIVDLWEALKGNQIAGWNSNHFDVPLIQQAASLAGYPDAGLDPWTSLDLFDLIRTRTQRWYKLEEVAQANLGRGKSGDGQSAAEWLRSGDEEQRQRAASYCALDVQLVIDLHGLAQTSGLVLPPRASDRTGLDSSTYRYWVNADGSAWQLAVDGGKVLDGEGWISDPDP